VKVREAGRIVPVAVTIAVGVNAEGRRAVLGMATGASEAETFWLDFLRSLARRGLRGVELVVSDAHKGLKAAVTKVFRATWQRGRVHSMRSAVAHAGKTRRRIVAAVGRIRPTGTAHAQEDAAAAHAQWRGAPTWSASFPTRPPSSASSAPSSSSSPTNGPPSAPAP
jgi:putative transposase